MKSNTPINIAGIVLVSLLAGACAPGAGAAPLTSAKVTETKNVVLYKPAAGQERTASVADVIQGADVLRTGSDSLAEVEFSDKTITRLGSKSVFTFSAGTRQFHPGRGTTLIYMPKGLGGGAIVTSAITAAIQGTTVIVEETEVPGTAEQPTPRLLSKVIFVEGHGSVSMTQPNARCSVQSASIGAGQMIAQYSDDSCLSPILNIDLQVLVKRSAIITAFSSPLPSMPEIQKVVGQQHIEVLNGTLQGPGGAGPYSPNPSTGGQGITDPPASQSSATQGSVIPVGGGFFISSRPLPGSQPIQGGGGFVLRP